MIPLHCDGELAAVGMGSTMLSGFAVAKFETAAEHVWSWSPRALVSKVFDSEVAVLRDGPIFMVSMFLVGWV